MTDTFRIDPDGNLRFELLEEVPWMAGSRLKHGFGTRLAALPQMPMAMVKQIHSAEILDASGSGGWKGEADALVSNSKGIAVGVKTADCVPIFLADPVGGVVAAIHAGWRGTVKEIVSRTLAQMAKNYETNPGDVYAAIGPAIGACCYEVGPEVAREFGKWDARLTSAQHPEHVDLETTNFDQLRGAGVRAERIARARLCTKRHSDLFFSFRKEGEQAGRMVSWIGIE